MATNFKIDVLKAMMDDNFFAAAYSDYLQDCAAAYASAYASVVESANDLTVLDTAYEYGTSGYFDFVSSKITEILNQHNLTGEELVTFSHGSATMRDVLTTVMTNTDKYSDITLHDASSALTSAALKLRDAAGAITTEISVVSVQEEFEKNLHSIVSTAGAAKAALQEGIADRITVYNDYVNSFFKDCYNDLSNSASYYKSLLTNSGGSACQIIANIISDMGIMNRSQDDLESEDQFMDTSALYQYTGASPVAALDFSSALKIVGASAAIIFGAVKTIATAVYNIGKAGFNWIRKKFTAAFKPNDLVILNEEATSYTIDGWMYQANKSSSGGALRVSVGDASDYSVDAVSKHSDMWMKYETIFAECLFRYSGYVIDQDTNTLYLDNVCIKYKPRCLNFDTVATLFATKGFETISGYDDIYSPTGAFYACKMFSQSDYDKVIEVLEQFKSSDLYLNPDVDNESDCWRGFQLSTILFWKFLHFQYLHNISDQDIAVAVYIPLGYVFSQAQITNKDFLTVAGVMINSDGVYQDRIKDNDLARMAGLDVLERVLGGESASGFTMLTPDGAFSTLFQPIIAQLSIKEDSPMDYPFLPYRKGVAGFLPARFGLRTDAENQQAVTSFLTNLVTVIIIAVIAVTAFIVIRKIRRNGLWKKKEYCSNVEGKLARGEQLSPAEKRKYVRYKRKLDASGMFGRNVQSTSSSQDSEASSNSDNATVSLDQLMRIITG